jgi:hypothetical protein
VEPINTPGTFQEHSLGEHSTTLQLLQSAGPKGRVPQCVTKEAFGLVLHTPAK